MIAIVDMIVKSGKFTKITKNCKKHGAYSAITYRNRCSPCPLCFEAKLAAEEQSKTDEKRQAEARHRVSIIGVPKRYENKTFDNYNINGNQQRANALDTVMDYAVDWQNVRKTGKSLLFTGKSGTGKTHLAVALAYDVASNNNATVKYTSLLDIMEQIKDAWNRRGTASTTDIINRLAGVDLLIIDEISAGYGTQSEQLQFFRIINKRYENMLPTVMISNANQHDTRAILGDATYDRLRESKGQLVSFDFESYRGVV